jgi:hypothetical protein
MADGAEWFEGLVASTEGLEGLVAVDEVVQKGYNVAR